MDYEFEIMRLRQKRTLAKHIAIHGCDAQAEPAKMRLARYDRRIHELEALAFAKGRGL